MKGKQAREKKCPTFLVFTEMRIKATMRPLDTCSWLNWKKDKKEKKAKHK